VTVLPVDSQRLLRYTGTGAERSGGNVRKRFSGAGRLLYRKEVDEIRFQATVGISAAARKAWPALGRRCRLSLAGVAAAIILALQLMGSAQAAAKVIPVALIDPFSGPFGPVGIAYAQELAFMVKKVNRSGALGRYKLKLVLFDDKVSPAVAQLDAEKAADEGIHYLVQGLGSNVAFALVHWLKKHNRNHPKDKILYLNYASIDPGLSNGDCGFYHFNFDANVNMKMAALVSYIKSQKEIHKVFLINMDYSYGHAVDEAAREMLQRARPDIKIVGDLFTPIGKVKDYTPFVYQIKQSGAQAVITGNWGADMALLGKAAGQARLTGIRFFTFYAGMPGTPQAIGDIGAGRIMQITPWVATVKSSETRLATEFKAEYHTDWYYGSQVYLTGMLAKAIEEAGTDDPTRVALHLEGMHYDSPVGDVYMRADNNAAVMPMYLSILEKGVKPYLQGTDMQWRAVGRIPAISMMLPSSCHMVRPKAAVLYNAYYDNTGQ